MNTINLFLHLGATWHRMTGKYGDFPREANQMGRRPTFMKADYRCSGTRRQFINRPNQLRCPHKVMKTVESANGEAIVVILVLMVETA